MQDEKQLVVEIVELRNQIDKFNNILSDLEIQLKEKESAIIQLLEDKGAKSTAKYEGIGMIGMERPKLYANIKKEFKENLFSFLADIGREDIIKRDIHPSTLNVFIGECINSGIEFPDYVTYYLKPKIKLYRS